MSKLADSPALSSHSRHLLRGDRASARSRRTLWSNLVPRRPAHQGDRSADGARRDPRGHPPACDDERSSPDSTAAHSSDSIAALALSRFLSSLLFSIGPHDPFAFALVTVLLVLIGAPGDADSGDLRQRSEPHSCPALRVGEMGADPTPTRAGAQFIVFLQERSPHHRACTKNSLFPSAPRIGESITLDLAPANPRTHSRTRSIAT